MNTSSPPIDSPSTWNRLLRAFDEFLAIPTGIIAGFGLLAVATVWVDRAAPEWVSTVRGFIVAHAFTQPSTTNSFLGMLTTGLITMTSITFSMLLLALQQSASLIGAQVVNSFLLRRRNQVLLGLFLGATIFVLVVHAAANTSFNPAVGAALALLLTIGAIYGLGLLLFSAINQMRPQAVVSEVRTLTLEARRRQRELLVASYREPRYTGGTEQRIHTEEHGYIRAVDLGALRAALQNRQGEAEIEILREIGEFAAYGEEIARVRAERADEAERLAAVTKKAVDIDHQRATRRDPSFGVEQILMMGWSSGSTAYQNPGIAAEAIRNLRDIVGRWVVDYDEVEGSGGTIPLVYPDGLVERAIEAMGALAVVSTESLQFTVYEEVIRAYDAVFDRLPDHLQDRVATSLERLVTGLGDHVMTRSLEEAFNTITETLREAGYADTADTVAEARRQMVSTAGSLAARSSRVKQATTGGDGSSSG